MIRLALTAIILEAAIGYPAWLHRRIPHPVTYLGSAISALERRWNRAEFSETVRRVGGTATLALIAGGAALAGFVATRILGGGGLGQAAWVLLATTGLAQRSLYDHVATVRAAFARDDLADARRAVGRLVGRDVEELNSAGVTMAALESLAESFNDGVVAPAFWLVVGGLPGLFAYKAVNTADSMIGHWEPRWRSFGWASARTDDLMNFVPARLAGVLIVLAGGQGWRTMARDARKHSSPNAGWPEAAMAGALGVRLGGPAHYDGVRVDRAVFGDGVRAEPHDLGRGLRVYVRACGLLWLVAAGAAICWR